MANITFSYLYRDAGNYKKRNSVVFTNPEGLTLDSIAQALQNSFLQDGLFIAHQVRLPEIFLSTEGEASSDDHCFHEFDSVELSPKAPNDRYERTIGQFLLEVKDAGNRGWIAFDPHDRPIQQVSDWNQ